MPPGQWRFPGLAGQPGDREQQPAPLTRDRSAVQLRSSTARCRRVIEDAGDVDDLAEGYRGRVLPARIQVQREPLAWVERHASGAGINQQIPTVAEVEPRRRVERPVDVALAGDHTRPDG